MTSVYELAEEWLRLDKDERTRDEIQNLVRGKQEEELEKRLRPRIAFGTAGLRARMEAGFARMNALIIIQTSQGLASYLLESVPETKTKGFVIGYDGRHNSLDFAKLTAAAFVSKGIKVWWFEDLVHTPLVPFAVNMFQAAGGVMVTASHNPAQDNGFKVYGSNACQIVSPHDKAVSASIQENLNPISWDRTITDRPHPLVTPVLKEVTASYYPAVVHCANLPQGPLTIPFVYTPMHGVGLPFMREVMSRLNLESHMIVVEEQAKPDPDFPTVRFPNPEERGALDLAMATADRHSISLVIANDPDADRFAVAEKFKQVPPGTWHQFTGNQVGILLAIHLLSLLPLSPQNSKPAMLSTLPSTSILSYLSHLSLHPHHPTSHPSLPPFHHTTTLTGFKHLSNRSIALSTAGYDPIFAFEEALGYMFPSVVRDKDAITAGAVFLSAVARWHAQGHTASSKLRAIYDEYGWFESRNTYLVSPSAAITTACFEEVRARGTTTGDASSPSMFPERCGRWRVTRWIDLTRGWDSGTPGNKPELESGAAGGEMITFDLGLDEDGGGEVVEDGEMACVRVTMRGSGTEPKIKFYVEARGGSQTDAGERAAEVLKEVVDIWFRADGRGLGRAY